MIDPFKSHAMLYADRGFQVVPIKPGAKGVPLTPNGAKDGSNDPAVIEAWIAAFPAANIALVTGPHSGELGMILVDVDKHHGGFHTMRQLVDKHGDLPPGPRSQTPHGGVHLFYRYRSGLVQGTDKLGAGLDVKITNGMAMAPPSYWDGAKGGVEVLPGGGRYRWLTAPQGSLLPEMPEWMVKALTVTKPTAPPATVDYGQPDAETMMAMLAFIPNDQHDLWVRVGMGLKAGLGDGGFALFDTWSAAGYDGYNPAETRRRWQSFKRDGVGIATIVYQAQQNGAPVKEILNKSRQNAA